ncbi:MAG: hypothetical protein U0798_17665 [Gemmataceae bacterium]
MKLSPSVRGSIRQFAFWVANRSVGHPLLEGIDIAAIFEEPSAMEAAFAVFCNVLEMDETGVVTNFTQAERRAAEHIRAYCDPTYQPDIPFESDEVELYPVSTDRWSG